MNTQIKTYYIPENPNILKGTIYNLYINNNNNLDLSTILFPTEVTSTNIPTQQSAPQTQPIAFYISENDYNRLLELNNLSFQLFTKKNTDFQNFISEDSKVTAELNRVNQERQELIKKLTRGKEVL